MGITTSSDGRLMYQTGDHSLAFRFEGELGRHINAHYSITKEPLAKALGIKGGGGARIWDLTCGTAKDALLIISYGAQVTAFERHPIVSALLQDALKWGCLNPHVGQLLSDNLQLFACDVRSFSPEKLAELPIPSAIYIDPMYTDDKKRSAAPRKEMAIFKNLVGADIDSKDLVQWAISTFSCRVVVKRSLHADPIITKPDIQFTGKSTRYDVYLRR